MATFLDVESLTYCGKEYQEILSRDLYGLDIRSIGATFMDNVKGKVKLYTGEIGDVWQKYSCPWTPQGSASLAESYMEPEAIKVNIEGCFSEQWNSFLVEGTSITLAGGLAPTFADWMFAKVREKMAKEYQEIAFKGDTAHTGNKEYLKTIDGWEKQLKADAGVKVTLTAFTVDNILAQVEDVIAKGIEKAANDEVDTENYKVLMNHNDVRLLEQALGKLCCPSQSSIFSNYAKGANGAIIINGYEVRPTMQSRNTVIFGDPRNLVLGFDTFDSHLEYRFINMKAVDGSDTYRIVALSNIALGIVWKEGMTFGYVA